MHLPAKACLPRWPSAAAQARACLSISRCTMPASTFAASRRATSFTLDRIGYLRNSRAVSRSEIPGLCAPFRQPGKVPEFLADSYKCSISPTMPMTASISFCSATTKSFEKFCKAIGFEDWLANPDFNTADARDKHKQAIYKSNRRLGSPARQI